MSHDLVHNVRPCRDDERAAILAIVNAPAQAYRGLKTCWTVPDRQIEASAVLAHPPIEER